MVVARVRQQQLLVLAVVLPDVEFYMVIGTAPSEIGVASPVLPAVLQYPRSIVSILGGGSPLYYKRGSDCGRTS